jgi:pimeloyl-ACP methyl ester carboxylesterase
LAFAIDHPERIGKLVVSGAAARLSKEGLAALVAMAEKMDGVDAKARADACKVLQDTDLTPLLHRLNVPTLVIGGELDEVTPSTLTKATADKVPGARYVELKGCGHCPPLEQPQQLLAAIREFVGL